MSKPPLSTSFAPAERLDREQVQEQSRTLLTTPLLDGILQIVPFPVVVLNGCRQIISANRAFVDLAGAADEEAILGLRHGEALDCAYARITESGCGTSEFCRHCGAVAAILHGLSGHANSNECTILRANGEALELRMWIRPFIIGDHAHLFCFLNDCSDEKRRRLLERIFFHDVLDTASGIHGFSGLLCDRLHEGEPREIADILLRLSREIMDEIQCQKELLAAESGELMVREDVVSILAFLNEVAATYREQLVGRDKRIAVESDGCEDHLVVTDRHLLRRVLVNMCKNALEASRASQTVTLKSHVEGGEVVFEVHNETPMPRDVQLQVFKRSFSTKGKGRGIGTYSIKLLGENYLKGRVGFASTAEEGTTFWLRLPRK